MRNIIYIRREREYEREGGVQVISSLKTEDEKFIKNIRAERKIFSILFYYSGYRVGFSFRILFQKITSSQNLIY